MKLVTVPSDEKDLQASTNLSTPGTERVSSIIQINRAPVSYGSMGPHEITNSNRKGVLVSQVTAMELCGENFDHDGLVVTDLKKKPVRRRGPGNAQGNSR